MTSDARQHAQTLWDYHRLAQPLQAADAMLVLCSHDLSIADYAARLYLDGWAPLVIFSGGLGSITRAMWSRPEAEQFADIAEALGVPRDRILTETASTNTGENVRFTRALLTSHGLDPASVLLVQKPYMERRSYATFRQVWPGKSVRVTSPPVSMGEYLEGYACRDLSEGDVIAIMVGDLQRIKVYADRGFQIPQDIPADVWGAFEYLVAAGYSSRLVEPL